MTHLNLTIETAPTPCRYCLATGLSDFGDPFTGEGRETCARCGGTGFYPEQAPVPVSLPAYGGNEEAEAVYEAEHDADWIDWSRVPDADWSVPFAA